MLVFKHRKLYRLAQNFHKMLSHWWVNGARSQTVRDHSSNACNLQHTIFHVLRFCGWLYKMRRHQIMFTFLHLVFTNVKTNHHFATRKKLLSQEIGIRHCNVINRRQMLDLTNLFKMWIVHHTTRVKSTENVLTFCYDFVDKAWPYVVNKLLLIL